MEREYELGLCWEWELYWELYWERGYGLEWDLGKEYDLGLGLERGYGLEWGSAREFDLEWDLDLDLGSYSVISMENVCSV